jgi:hypothetical protein
LEKILDRILNPTPVAPLGDPVKALETYYRIDKIKRGLKMDDEQFDRLGQVLTGKENQPGQSSQTSQANPPAQN